jgi:adenosylhomocysteine nucleosidase
MSSRWIIFFAVAEEARPFLQRRLASGDGSTPLTPPIPGAKGWRVDNGDIWVTGMGARNAGAVAEAVVQADAVDWVLTCGFAGGLDPALTVGTVVADLDPWHPLPFGPESGVRRGRFHLASQVAVTADAKARLRAGTGADAVDMESAVIRDICGARGVPSGTVRVISDAAGEDLPLDFGALMTPNQQIDVSRLMGVLARSPGKIIRLIQFSRLLGKSSAKLARVLDGEIRRGA